MAFRADEAAEVGFEKAKRYLINHQWPSDVRAQSTDCLYELTLKYGPIVSRYPTWHPFVRNHDPRIPEIWPNERNGYVGLDHTVGFVNAFLTCPYSSSGNAERLYKSIRTFEQHHAGYIAIESVDAQFYSPDAKPILVVCDWSKPLETDCKIPKSLAVPLMIENELRGWEASDLAERWDTMRPYLLGEPHGARSSLFVGQETALALKKTYIGMVESGMFGPLRMD